MRVTTHVLAAAGYAVLAAFAVGAAAQVTAGDIDFDQGISAVDIQLVINAALDIDIDSDDDGLADAAELMLGLDPYEPDSDGNGVNDLQQLVGVVPDELEPGAIVINEVLAHSHLGASDWIELHNTTNRPIDIGGWFLSDDEQTLRKYEIEDPTVIEPGEYVVFYENAHFGNEFDSGVHELFGLNETGEAVYVSSGKGGELTEDYRDDEDFGASASGVAFGRYHKVSTDTFNFVAMSENTPGGPNAYPLVGPIVINEIMYNPPSGNQDEEYIELYNISDSPVDLFDASGNPWKFTNGIEFSFPPDTTIAAGGYLVVAKDLQDFILAYNSLLPPGVPLVGPYDAQLSGAGEVLEISMPSRPGPLDDLAYVRIDRVNYDDEDPWPTEPDGGSGSLNRIVPDEYGNDFVNWEAGEATPGQ